MRTSLFIISLMFTINSSFAQENSIKLAEFVGGDKALTSYLKENLIYPERAVKDSIEGYFKIAIAIDDRGRPIFSDFIITMENCEECENEALRLINKMPRWTPKMVNDKPTFSSSYVTIVFELQEGNVKIMDAAKTAKLNTIKATE